MSSSRLLLLPLAALLVTGEAGRRTAGMRAASGRVTGRANADLDAPFSGAPLLIEPNDSDFLKN